MNKRFLNQSKAPKSNVPYVFFRGSMWYPIELRDDADAIANALHNPGTTKVEDAKGRIVWELPTEKRNTRFPVPDGPEY